MEELAPTLVWALEKFVPLRSVKEFLVAGDFLYGYGRDAVREYIEREGRGASSRPTLLTKLVVGNKETGAEPLSDEEIVVEVSNLMFAAVDTTGTSATYALYELACNPGWQRRLQQEIRTSGVGKKGFEYRTVSELPVLNAVVTENLRMHPAAPSALPRQTVGPVTVIDGLPLPEGILVSMQAMTTQRDPAYFPDPDKFDPARWLAPGPDGKEQIFPGTPEMQEMMLVWGGKGGPRSCPGRYMATMEMKLLLARLMDRYTVALESEATHDDMVMTDHFALIPKGGRCGLVVSRHDV
ncbi:cytochrome P450 [Cercophora newfieldiana]|uniref:Cytochrome P450 n=1 Tax=Cercophora newfieldiana TaxID=92897 RepID=A0AA40CKI1_9PEZI|nr:cytochrome P450 [Cercophora newfieldiana]